MHIQHTSPSYTGRVASMKGRCDDETLYYVRYLLVEIIRYISRKKSSDIFIEKRSSDILLQVKHVMYLATSYLASNLIC
jgi:hypothetical protein